jgi:hypothetical protein
MIPFLAIMAENLILPADGPGREFERIGHSNGGRFWYARDFMKLLGYENFSSFQKAINKGNRYLHDPRYPRCGKLHSD